MNQRRELTDIVEESRDRLLARSLAEITHRLNHKPNLLQRVLRPVVNAWAMLWAVALYWPTMLINLGIRRGWIVRVDA